MSDEHIENAKRYVKTAQNAVYDTVHPMPKSHIAHNLSRALTELEAVEAESKPKDFPYEQQACTKMPKFCVRGECRDLPMEEIELVENESGFITCPSCGYSYGEVAKSNPEPTCDLIESQAEQFKNLQQHAHDAELAFDRNAELENQLANSDKEIERLKEMILLAPGSDEEGFVEKYRKWWDIYYREIRSPGCNLLSIDKALKGE